MSLDQLLKMSFINKRRKSRKDKERLIGGEEKRDGIQKQRIWRGEGWTKIRLECKIGEGVIKIFGGG